VSVPLSANVFRIGSSLTIAAFGGITSDFTAACLNPMVISATPSDNFRPAQLGNASTVADVRLNHVHQLPLFDEVQTEPMKMNAGYYDVPTAPGLGVDMNEEVIAAHPVRDRAVIEAFYANGTPAQP